MKTLDDLTELGFTLPGVALTRTGLALREGASEEDYLRLEAWLDVVGGSSRWWWGDYLNHLARMRGKEYAEAKAASAYAPQSLKNAAWVCRHVDASRRRDRLSFEHHAEAASLTPTDQEIWLDRAEDEAWSVKQLRAEIRQSKAQVSNGPDQAPSDQRAARASAAFEEFATWYGSAAESFTPDQREEWDSALEPLVNDYLARHSR